MFRLFSVSFKKIDEWFHRHWLLVLVVVLMGLLLWMLWPRTVTAVARFADGTMVRLEVAKTDEARRLGLSFRDELPLGEGMLFVFPEKIVPTFWMKDMRFPIDLLWLDGERVVGVEENMQPSVDVDATRVTPSVPINRVIELPAGFVARHGSEVDLQ